MSRIFWRSACLCLVLAAGTVSAKAHDGHHQGESSSPAQAPAVRPSNPFYGDLHDRPPRDEREDDFRQYDRPVRSQSDVFHYSDDDAGYGMFRKFDPRRDSGIRFQQYDAAPHCTCDCASGRQRSVPRRIVPKGEYSGQRFDAEPPADFSHPRPLPGENRYEDHFVPDDSSRPSAGPQLPDLGSNRQSTPRREIAAQPVIPLEMKGIAQLPPADQRAALKQRICPVTRDLLGSMGKPHKVSALGRTLFVCCQGCVDEIRENPRKYLSDSAP